MEYRLDALGRNQGVRKGNDVPRAVIDAELLAKGAGATPRFSHWTLHRGRRSCLFAPGRSGGGAPQRTVQRLATVERPTELLQAESIAARRSECIAERSHSPGVHHPTSTRAPCGVSSLG